MRLESNSPWDTEKIGSALADIAFPGLLILLWGDLGAGKTTLIRGFVGAFGFDNVRSPSFTLINEYDCAVPIAHADLYRLDTCDLRSLGLDEYLDLGWVLLVEWPERLISPEEEENIINVRMIYRESDNGPSEVRMIDIDSIGEKAGEALALLERKML